MAKLLFVGNSHLASFKKAFEARNEGLESFESEFVALNFVSAQWKDPKLNQSFRRFQIEMPGEPLRIVDFTGEKALLHLVFVGRGLGGDGMVRCHGSLAHNKTPVLPETYNSPVGGRECSARLSMACLWNIYESDIRHKLNELDSLAALGHFATVHWIMGPDMTLRSGMVRFGKETVESGLYAFHRNLYSVVFEKIVREYDGMNLRVIQHPVEFMDQSGFTRDQFALDDRPFEDIHVSPDFFHSALINLGHKLKDF